MAAINNKKTKSMECGRNQQQENKEHGVFLSERSPTCLSVIKCWHTPRTESLTEAQLRMILHCCDPSNKRKRDFTWHIN